MKKISLILLILALLVLTVAACGGDSQKAPDNATDDVAAGKVIFEKTVLGANPGCITCHAIEGDEVLVGPSLAGIGNKGEDFIRTSILDPDAEITEGFTPGIMPKNIKDDLSEQELGQLVKYLLTLK